MSRIGKRPIVIPEKVKAEVTGRKVKVAGPLGHLDQGLTSRVTVTIEGKNIVVKRAEETREARAEHGMIRALINNMVTGVTQGFHKNLDIVGIGYKGEIQGKNLVLNAGFSHPVIFTPPEGITVKMEKQTRIVVSGADRQLVGETAARIRKIRLPEPYKGKGIRYSDEVVKRKVGKAAVVSGGGGT